jgi:hypothetical protein
MLVHGFLVSADLPLARASRNFFSLLVVFLPANFTLSGYLWTGLCHRFIAWLAILVAYISSVDSGPGHRIREQLATGLAIQVLGPWSPSRGTSRSPTCKSSLLWVAEGEECWSRRPTSWPQLPFPLYPHSPCAACWKECCKCLLDWIICFTSQMFCHPLRGFVSLLRQMSK